jgi:hypothetical protein
MGSGVGSMASTAAPDMAKTAGSSATSSAAYLSISGWIISILARLYIYMRLLCHATYICKHQIRLAAIYNAGRGSRKKTLRPGYRK